MKYIFYIFFLYFVPGLEVRFFALSDNELKPKAVETPKVYCCDIQTMGSANRFKRQIEKLFISVFFKSDT